MIYRVVNLEENVGDKSNWIPVKWNKLPKDLIENLSEEYFDEVYCFNKRSCSLEKISIIILERLEDNKFDKDSYTSYKFNDKLIILENGFQGFL